MQNSSKVLDDIINSKKYHLYKSGLGYNQIEKGSRSKTIEKETYPKIYAETIKGDRKIYKEDYRCYHSKKPFVVADQRCLVT